jgi:hypothetical protein
MSKRSMQKRESLRRKQAIEWPIVSTTFDLDYIDPKELGDGMEATVEPGDAMTESDLDAFDPARTRES